MLCNLVQNVDSAPRGTTEWERNSGKFLLPFCEVFIVLDRGKSWDGIMEMKGHISQFSLKGPVKCLHFWGGKDESQYN